MHNFRAKLIKMAAYTVAWYTGIIVSNCTNNFPLFIFSYQKVTMLDDCSIYLL